MIVDNLESYSANLPLSANMGRELNEYIMSVEEYVVSISETIPTITVGQTTTGQTAGVTNSGTSTDIVLDFTIPSSGGSSNNSITKIWS